MGVSPGASSAALDGSAAGVEGASLPGGCAARFVLRGAASESAGGWLGDATTAEDFSAPSDAAAGASADAACGAPLLRAATASLKSTGRPSGPGTISEGREDLRSKTTRATFCGAVANC